MLVFFCACTCPCEPGKSIIENELDSNGNKAKRNRSQIAHNRNKGRDFGKFDKHFQSPSKTLYISSFQIEFQLHAHLISLDKLQNMRKFHQQPNANLFLLEQAEHLF